MKIAVCDDEKIYLDRLQDMLLEYLKHSQIHNYEIEVYASGNDLLENFAAGAFDYIFLDADMPQLNGFDTARKIREMDVDVNIVFVTHMEDHIHMGYRYGAKEYLCKPVSQQQISVLMERLLDEHVRKQGDGFYAVRLKDGGTAYLRLSDVLYFESQDHYILAVMASNKIIFRDQLLRLAADLEEKGFIRTHQSYLVNIRHVFKDFGDQIVLIDGARLPISRKYKNAVKAKLLNF